ncbi:hypothetical protein G6F35_018647 [Rhizopus arrhizus]|nr:hypothetical protein G6F35_018647 [Rhizopus arrhizus]
MRGRVHGGRAHRVVGTLAWPVYRRQRSEQAASKPFSRDAPCRRLGRACWHLAGPAGAGPCQHDADVAVARAVCRRAAGVRGWPA